MVFKASRGIEDIYELTYIRKDGSRFPAIVSVTALHNDRHEIIGYLLIGTDNTARKQVEVERMQLEQRVRDQQFYTHSLIESSVDALITTDPRSRLELQMREQAAELSDLHRRKDESPAMLSHELRSPLAPIASAVHVLGLQGAHESLTQKQARGIIERQMGQLKHLVDDLLEVSRITSGRVQLRRESVLVNAIVEVAIISG